MRSRLIALAVMVTACSTGGSPPGVPSPPSVTVSSTSSTEAPETTVPASTTTSAAPETTSPPDTTVPAGPPEVQEVEEYPVPGSRPHDVAVAGDGTVWYTAQRSGSLDRLDPTTGEVTQVPLGDGSAPHGVIFGPDDGAWVTDQGLNALVRVDHDSLELEVYPAEVDVGMHTAVFAPGGIIWFTGQSGYLGRFDPESGQMDLYETGGGGPYGITATPVGDVYFAALGSSYIARVDTQTGEITRIDPPTPGQGARRVWTDSGGDIWVSYWNTGHLARFEPGTETWAEWSLPGDNPQAYAVYVDETDHPWVSDFGGDDALLRFDPDTESFESFPLPAADGEVRQILGRPGEVWGAESAVDALVVVRYAG